MTLQYNKIENDLKRQIKRRNGVVFSAALLCVFLVASVILVKRLFQYQFVEHEEILSEANSQHYLKRSSLPERGNIIDRNGYPIVCSSYVYRIGYTPSAVYSDKKMISNADIITKAKEFLSLDDKTVEEMRQTLLVKNDEAVFKAAAKSYFLETVPYIALKSGVDAKTYQNFSKWLSDYEVNGFNFEAVESRKYADAGVAAPVIGVAVVDKNNRLSGQSGIESYYDDILRGKSGFIYGKTNNYGNKGIAPFSNMIETPAFNGKTLISTLNQNAEKILRDELRYAAAVAGQATGVSGIIMDPKNGDILAMEQLPFYDLENPTDTPMGIKQKEWQAFSEKQRAEFAGKNIWPNQNISALYEPGSTFKTLTLAIALEEKASYLDKVYNDDPIEIQEAIIHCFTGKGHGYETLREGFFRSCNPVFVQVGTDIGKEVFYKYLQELNIMGTTGIDLGGEISGIFHDEPMDIDFANLTFGESSTMTPITLIKSYCPLVNGGYMVKPRVICGYVDADEQKHMFEFQKGKYIFSAETCKQINTALHDGIYMSGHDTFGTEGFNFGGKSGTSTDEIAKVDTFSFCAAAPLDDPRYLILVVMRHPKNELPSSVSAARVSNRIAAKLMVMDGEKANYSDNDLAYLSKSYEIPDLSGMSLRQAALLLSKNDIAVSIDADAFYLDDPVKRVWPAAGSVVGVGSTVFLSAEAKKTPKVAVPDFIGKNYDECVFAAEEAGVTVVCDGIAGTSCTAQSIRPSEGKESQASGVDSSGKPLKNDRQKKVDMGTVITLSFNH